MDPGTIAAYGGYRGATGGVGTQFGKVRRGPDELNRVASMGGVKEFGKAGKFRAPSPKFGEIDEIGSLGQQKYEKTQGINEQLGKADDDLYGDRKRTSDAYMGSMRGATGQYRSQIEDLMQGARSESEMANKTYTGTTQPKLVNMLEKDMAEAYGPNGAMSLQEAGDPNNKVASSVRGMFNTEGQAQQDIFNQQGINAQNQGLAASGVLGALGAQNAASAFGSGGPMSVGQQQALFAASQGQAGQAFARAQQQMNNLRQQGILANTGLRSQGLSEGMRASDAQYQRGERAKSRAKDSVTQINDEQDRYLGQQARLRDERGRGAADLMGLDMGMAQTQKDLDDDLSGLGHSNKYKRGTRELGASNEYFGNQMGVLQGKSAIRNANQAGNAGMMSGLGGVAGTAIGSYFGGPAGGAAGGMAGRAAGSSGAGQQSAQYQQNPYNPSGEQYDDDPYRSPYGNRAYA